MEERLRKLYQQTLLAHHKAPHHHGTLQAPDATATAKNPTCGDWVRIDLALDASGRVTAAAWAGEGCAISRASASLLCDNLPGHDDPRAFCQALCDFLGGGPEPKGGLAGDLAALEGVRQHASRVRCALLPWQTALKALDAHRQERAGCGCQ